MANARLIAVLVAVVCAAGSGFAAVGQSVAQSVKDAAITGRIESMYLLNEHLNPFNINTTTSNGVVTISGSVADQIQKDLAEELAMSVEGVSRVNNQLTVVGNLPQREPRRGLRQRAEDLSTEASVRSRLLYHKEFKGLKLGVKVRNGVVTLYGVVGSEEQKRHIEEITYDTRGVDRVINNLSVQPKETGPDPVVNVGIAIGDEYVEKRVETAILFNRYISIRGLDVEVMEGLCILSGQVDTNAQRELAESIALNTQGVEVVRNDLEVRIDTPALPEVELPDNGSSPADGEPAPSEPAAPANPDAPETPDPADADAEIEVLEDDLPPPDPALEPYLPKEPPEDELLKD